MLRKNHCNRKKLDFLRKSLPSGYFITGSDGKVKFLGIIDPNSKSKFFPDLEDGGDCEDMYFLGS